MKPSGVLAAMHVPPELASGVIRVSFGATTSENDLDYFLNEWRGIRDRARSEAA
jgi:cysteine sulfinate desulfinase/cysteine desulfurase-like protein